MLKIVKKVFGFILGGRKRQRARVHAKRVAKHRFVALVWLLTFVLGFAAATLLSHKGRNPVEAVMNFKPAEAIRSKLPGKKEEEVQPA